MSEQTPTPRTDAKIMPLSSKLVGMEVLMADFARQLERESAALAAENERLEWVVSNRAKVVKLNDEDTWEVYLPSRGLPSAAARTRNEAIDAARAAAPKGGMEGEA